MRVMKRGPHRWPRPTPNSLAQQGFGLLNMLLAVALTLIALTTMVVLLASTLGRNSTTLQMTQLTRDLRGALQLMTRDVRRANYHSSFLQCFANTNCRAELGIENYVNTINIDADGDCFWFWLDRNGDGDLSNDSTGAYRRGVVNGVGVIQMRVDGNGAAQCDLNDGWELITDPAVVDVSAFTVDDTASYTEILSQFGDTQTVEKIRFTITGQLVRNTGISKVVQDLVHVRNDILSPPS